MRKKLAKHVAKRQVIRYRSGQAVFHEDVQITTITPRNAASIRPQLLSKTTYSIFMNQTPRLSNGIKRINPN